VLLQLEELMGGVDDDRRFVLKDYFRDQPARLDRALEALSDFSTEDLLDLKTVAGVLHLPAESSELDAGQQPRGYRLLSKIPRLPDAVIERIVRRFGTLQKILRATTDDLDDVEGVGTTRARAIKDGLARLAETSILDRYI
jgi:diadenylate cyclase